MTGLLEYDMGGGVRAFTAGRDVPLPCAVVQPHQTHSTVVAHVDRAGLTREDLEGVDALVTDLQGVAIGVRTADCIPVLLYDPVHRAIGSSSTSGASTNSDFTAWNPALANLSGTVLPDTSPT